MDISIQKRNAKKFIEEWKNRGREKQDSQSFWLSLLRDILGVEKPEEVIRFEEKVKLSHDSFIDAYVDQTHTMIEQKGANKDLDKAIRQSDGSMLTPFQQAQRYSMALPYSKRPRWIVTCNFVEFRVYDMEHPNSEPTKIELKDLATDFYQLDFLIDQTDAHIEKEKQVSLSAGELVGKIYDELLKQYKDPNDPHSQKSINQLCVRIVFCLYAEDSGIFGRKKMFHDYLKDYDAHHTRLALIRLFKILDTKVEDRDPYLADDEPKLAEFPYVNGGMFSDEDIEIPSFTDELRDLLLSNASDNFDWSDISPTIFGAVFESTLNPETRRQGGMHYTSVENIHKVIDPLFLDDLKDELSKIKKIKQPASLKKKARAFQEKLANLTFFDPACGSGNFLTETYLQLRRLENEAIKLIYPNPTLDVGQAKNMIRVSIQQFFGIEINDFAVSVAKTALWIAESQMWEETKDIFFADWDFLPLKTYTHIHEGDALKMDWNKVIENYGCDYIIGNPPFVGSKKQTPEQKEDQKNIFKDVKKVGMLDFVACWYAKATEYMQGTHIQTAFVSTDSIVQGTQVPVLWKFLLDRNIQINFAYRSFKWESEAKSKAQVICVIIGFTTFKLNKPKYIFEENQKFQVKNISPYLTDSSNVFIKSKQESISKAPRIMVGTILKDNNNYVFTYDEMKNFLAKEPQAKPLFHKYYMGRDFLNSKPRYVLWFKNADPSKLNHMPLVIDRIKKVKDFRSKADSKDTRHYMDDPLRPARFMYYTNEHKSNALAIPRISAPREYIPMDIVDKDAICGDKIFLTEIYNTYLFGLLESKIHTAWVKTLCTRLGNGFSYSNTIVYNTFPFPNATDKQKEKIEKTAQAILDARKLYPDSSLADLYNPLTMPSKLREAHQANDRAVLKAYGLSTKATESEIVAHLFKMYEKLTKNEK